MDYITCSLIVSAITTLSYTPLLPFTHISKVNVTSALLFALSGVLAPGLARLFFFQSIQKVGALITSSVMPSQPIITAIFASLILYYAIYFFKIKKDRLIKSEDFKLMFSTGIIMALAWIFTFYVLSYGEVTKVTPIIDTQPLFIYFLAHFFPKEIGKVNLRPLIGAIIILTGLILFLFI